VFQIGRSIIPARSPGDAEGGIGIGSEGEPARPVNLVVRDKDGEGSV
jgi:hypothetical protein